MVQHMHIHKTHETALQNAACSRPIEHTFSIKLQLYSCEIWVAEIFQFLKNITHRYTHPTWASNELIIVQQIHMA